MRRTWLARRGARAGAILAAIAVALLAADRGGDSGPNRGTAPTAEGSKPTPAVVTRVVDGDTIEVRLPDGAEEDVRYIGVDTPESVDPDEPPQCFGHRAAELNRRLVEGRRVELRFDAERRDRYGRLLAYVRRGEVLVNAELVRRGRARTLTIAPNDSRARLFDKLQTAAGRAGRGLWGACR